MEPNNIEDVAEDIAAENFVGDGRPFGMENMPSVEEIWKLIEQMDDISDEDRASLREGLFNPQDNSPEEFMKRLAGQATAAVVHSKWDYMIFVAMFAIVFIVFGLFGYKLYRSLKDKELKKQEKQKNKQAKKLKKAN